MDMKLLAIYLNDHLAGATAGTSLAKRAGDSNRLDARYDVALAELAKQIDEDHQSLLAILSHLDIGIDRVKLAIAWVGERLSRVKLNGRMFSYSPLSRLDELESLKLGVTGKRCLWISLALIAPSDPRLRLDELNSLIARADAQIETLESLRQTAVRDAFGPRS
jgi:hypothetical protein